MEKKRLLIIGASDFQLPAILKAKEMGLVVGVADMNPQAVGVSYADEFYCVSTIDEDGISKAAAEFKADGVVTLCTDMPMRALSRACEDLGLRGLDYDSAIRSTDKGKMIKAFEKAEVLHPKFIVITGYDDYVSMVKKIEEKLQYPMITKPTDNSGSRGIMLVKNRQQLADAMRYSLGNCHGIEVIVEEYMCGPEFSVEIIVADGIPHVLQITDKLTSGAPHFVELGHSQPSRFSKKDQEEIADLAVRAALAVGIANGAAHAEVILTNFGPKMVEIGARMGGDCITTHLVPLSTGIDMTKAMIQTALGEKPDLERRLDKASAIRFIRPHEGTISAIFGIEKATAVPGIQVVEIQCKVGQHLKELENGTGRIGYVIAQADTPDEAVRICESALDFIKITVE